MLGCWSQPLLLYLMQVHGASKVSISMLWRSTMPLAEHLGQLRLVAWMHGSDSNLAALLPAGLWSPARFVSRRTC